MEIHFYLEKVHRSNLEKFMLAYTMHYILIILTVCLAAKGQPVIPMYTSESIGYLPDMFQSHEIKTDKLYSIHGFWNDEDYAYLSYHEKSGWCRQNSEKSSDSMFQFVECNADKNKWYIRNMYNDTRMNKWLSYDNYYHKNMVGLWSNIADRAVWKLIPQNTSMTFKIKCFYNDKFKGWLSFQWSGRWNKLYTNESDATLYRLEEVHK
eukprot:115879_1